MCVPLVSREERDPASGDPTHVRVEGRGTVQQRLLGLFWVPYAGTPIDSLCPFRLGFRRSLALDGG